MLTNGEFVGRVVNDLNALTKDAHISKRWILSIGQTKSESYVIQQWENGGLWDDLALLTCVNCIRMIEVDKIECCDAAFALCHTLMRSEERLPGLVFASRGPIIRSVTNVDGARFYHYERLEAYRNRQKRKYASKSSIKHFYVHDGYIYIPDDHIELINVCFFTMKRRLALALSACKPVEGCYSEWDEEFIYPMKMIEYIVSETMKECATKISIPEDENPDLDSNQKTRTSE